MPVGYQETKSRRLATIIKDAGFQLSLPQAAKSPLLLLPPTDQVPIIGILAEFDAPSGASQTRRTLPGRKEQTIRQGMPATPFVWHGSVAAGIKTKQYMAEHGIDRYLYAFTEHLLKKEGGGKVYMVRAGLF